MINFENTYAQLPEEFFTKTAPTAAVKPLLIAFNQELAQSLNISREKKSDDELALIFSGKKILPTSTPIALAYSGHQFGRFNPSLGDGRAILLGEVVAKNQQRFDIQLKGSGPTQYSRNGDGMAALGPVVREYLVSEAMAALNIPTTRSLAAVLTGQTVFREKPFHGAMITRVAASHIRVGTFEYFASRGDLNNLKILTDYTIARHYPQLLEIADDQSRYNEFIYQVTQKNIALISQWMRVGFIHGVMNTDNSSVSGETIDFGPCAFMDEYNENKVFSSIDQLGRYKFNNQMNICLWNSSRLASTLLPLIGADQAEIIKKLEDKFEEFRFDAKESYYQVFSQKLGFKKQSGQSRKLVDEFLKILENEKLDFTNSFRNLANYLETIDPNHISKSDAINDFLVNWHKEVEQTNTKENIINLLNTTNPYLIPRNHFIQKAIDQASVGDYSYFNELQEAFKNPYTTKVELREFTTPPESHEIIHKTFCGT